MKSFLYIMIWMLPAFHSCGSKKEPAVQAETETPKDPDKVIFTNEQVQNAGIKTGTVEQRTMQDAIRLNGEVDVPPQNVVSVSFPMPAFLKSSSLLPGMHVRKGQSIGIMEDAGLIQLQQDYLVARSKLAYAELDYKRQQSLNETKTTSDKVFQQARAEFETQRVLVKALAEKLRLIGINPDRLSESNISRQVALHSPIDGFVAKVHVNTGRYIQPSEILFELINPDDLHAALTVFEQDIASIRPGQKVMVNFVDQPDQTYSSTVFLVTRNVDENRSGIIHCHFDQAPKDLRPGMFLNARLNVTEAKVPAVPESAVVRFENREYVFVQSGKNEFRMTPVTTGKRIEGYIELKEPQNAFEGQQIILTSAFTALSKLKNVSEE